MTVEDFKPKIGEPKVLDKIVTMRYNHYRDRCIETINRVLDKRRVIKERQRNMSLRLQHSNTKSASQLPSFKPVVTNTTPGPGRTKSKE